MEALRRIQVLVAAATCALALASPASALTFTILTDGKGVDLTCTKSCEVWDLALTPDGFRSAPLGAGIDSGDWLTGSYGNIGNGNSNTNRLDFVNDVLGTSFTIQSASSDNVAGVPAMGGYSAGDNGGWTSSAAYFLAWSGSDPRYVLVKNNSADNVFTWAAHSQSGSGLSGVDGFGVVPLPAAAWLLLFASGGLIAAKRARLRRQA